MNKGRKYAGAFVHFLKPKYLASFFAALFVFLCIKSFVFDVAFVSSPAMNNTLQQGEMVYVLKLFTPQKNDLVRIYLPLTSTDSNEVSSYVFKRVVATGGDTIEIRNGNVLLNGKPVDENDIFLHNYIAKIRVQSDTGIFSKAGIHEKFLIDDSCVYLIPVTRQKFMELKEERIFSSLVPSSEDSADFDLNVFPYQKQYKWNEDYFGPLYIPKKEDELRLDTNNINIYRRIIVDFEKNKLELMNGKIFINGKESAGYVVKQNYYFVTGDNFDNSIDSRNWGFIPQKKIRSRVVFKN
jgi:signal peptidase I